MTMQERPANAVSRPVSAAEGEMGTETRRAELEWYGASKRIAGRLHDIDARLQEICRALGRHPRPRKGMR